MNTADYKAAANKLKDFSHQAKLIYDEQYRVYFFWRQQLRKIIEDAMWSGKFCIDQPIVFSSIIPGLSSDEKEVLLYGTSDEPIAKAIMPRFLHI